MPLNFTVNTTMRQQRSPTKEQAFQKLKHYCAWQERCHSEVREKAWSLGLRKPDVEELISRLIEEDYLNEERFAKIFAGGKFRMKQWGRTKIRYELKQKKISEYCINRGLKEIDEKDYEQTLEKIARKRWASIKGPGVNHFVKMTKTRDFLLQKGFESELVQQVIAGIMKK